MPGEGTGVYWMRCRDAKPAGTDGTVLHNKECFHPYLEWLRQVRIHLLGIGMEEEPNSPEACGLLQEGDFLYKLGYLL